MWTFWTGMAVGVLLTIPLVWVASRRTERRVRRLEGRARAAERLAELGTLTGGLAHEIKNPLSTVGLNIQLLQEDLHDLASQADPDSELCQGIGRVERRLSSLSRETQRLRDILEDFLRFAGRIKLDRQVIDINTVVDELVDFFAAQAHQAGVHLRQQLAAGPLYAHADAGLLKQAVLNLLLNATQAMAEARQADRPHGGANELLLRVESASGDVLIHVTDTGPGIDAAHRDKIFQPYFSTKKRGTGLGLPTTRRIVEEHGGQITCHSEPGRGTDFTIAIPAHVDAPG